jgi:hypothetical protein
MHPFCRNSRGIALVPVVIMLGFLTALAATLALTVNMDTQTRGAVGSTMTGFYAAEAGLNKGMGDYRNIFLNFRRPSGADFNPTTFSLGRRTVTYFLEDKTPNPVPRLTIPPGQVFAGLSALQYDYTANSLAKNIRGEVEASVGAEFLVGYIPLFQFLAFYNGDLEILPGADMTLNGRIHTNGDLFLNSESGRTLSVEDDPPRGITQVQVTAKGDLYRGRKNTTQCTGTVRIDTLQNLSDPPPGFDPRDLNCIGGATAKVPQSEIAYWLGSIVTQIESISVPQPDIIARGRGTYWQSADLRIALVLNQTGELLPPLGPQLQHTIEVQDASGARDAVRTAALYAFMLDAGWNAASSTTPGTMPVFYTEVPNAPGSTCTNAAPLGCNNAATAAYTDAGNNRPAFSSNTRIYNTVMGAALGSFDRDYRRGGFYNWRERKWMQLLNVNIADLLRWNAANGAPFFPPGDTTDGGLVIFLSVVGPDSLAINNYGVRVFGSRELQFPPSADPTGLTIVSDQAIYIQGDYNSINWQPAAFLGDSINVLSNNYFQAAGCGANCWNDRQSNLNLADAARAAASTTINAAFLSGVDSTIGGTYNGGLENYPRFHESWSGRTLFYQGSYVSLGTPVHVNGTWCGTGGTCNIYNPPTRNWNYDPRFNDVANLPPMTPHFVYVQQVLFTEDFT